MLSVFSLKYQVLVMIVHWGLLAAVVRSSTRERFIKITLVVIELDDLMG